MHTMLRVKYTQARVRCNTAYPHIDRSYVQTSLADTLLTTIAPKFTLPAKVSFPNQLLVRPLTRIIFSRSN